MNPRKSLYNQLTEEYEESRFMLRPGSTIQLNPDTSDDISWIAHEVFFQWNKERRRPYQMTYKFHIAVESTADYPALLDCVFPIFEKSSLSVGKIVNHARSREVDQLTQKAFDEADTEYDEIYTNQPFATLNPNGILVINHAAIDSYKKYLAEAPIRTKQSIAVTIYIDDELLLKTDELTQFCKDIETALTKANIKPGVISSSDYKLNSFVSIRKDRPNNGKYVPYYQQNKLDFRDDPIIRLLVPKEVLDEKSEGIDEKKLHHENEAINIRQLIHTIINNNDFWKQQNQWNCCGLTFFNKIPASILALQKEFNNVLIPFDDALKEALKHIPKTSLKKYPSHLKNLYAALHHLASNPWKTYHVLTTIKNEIDAFSSENKPDNLVQIKPGPL